MKQSCSLCLKKQAEYYPGGQGNALTNLGRANPKKQGRSGVLHKLGLVCSRCTVIIGCINTISKLTLERVCFSVTTFQILTESLIGSWWNRKFAASNQPGTTQWGFALVIKPLYPMQKQMLNNIPFQRFQHIPET